MTEENVEVTELEEAEEIVENTEEQDIRSAFDEAVDSGEADEDEIKLAMITAGATFKNVTRLYNKFMESAGMALSKDAKTDLAKTAVSENDVTEESGFDAAVKYIVDNSDGKVKDRSAGGLIRAAAKKADIEFFKKPKAEAVPRVTFISKFFGMLIDNPNLSEKECEDHINDSGSKSAIRSMAHNQSIRKAFNDVAEKYGL